MISSHRIFYCPNFRLLSLLTLRALLLAIIEPLAYFFLECTVPCLIFLYSELDEESIVNLFYDSISVTIICSINCSLRIFFYSK